MVLEDKYNTDNELKIRKMLESWFPFKYTLEKNTDRYDYDICLYQIENYSEKKLIGYIELETTPSWDTYLLPSGYDYSFLARKVLKYDYEHEEFNTNRIKNEDKSPFTVYFKLNRDFTNGYCCDIPTIMSFNKVCIERYSDGSSAMNNYNDTFLRTEVNNKKVAYGLPVCKQYMLDFFIRSKKLDFYF